MNEKENLSSVLYEKIVKKYWVKKIYFLFPSNKYNKNIIKFSIFSFYLQKLKKKNVYCFLFLYSITIINWAYLLIHVIY